MGLLFLLVGYFFFCDLNIASASGEMLFDITPDVIGWILLCIGTWRGSAFSQKLGVARWIALTMVIPSALEILYNLNLWRMFFATEFHLYVYPYLKIVLFLLFHYYLLFGLKEIADGLGDQKILSMKLARNFYLTLFCFAWILLAQVLRVFATDGQTYSTVTTFSTMIYLLSNEFLMFRFMRCITLE